MKLSFAPRTRAVRARWILEELGVPYELVRADDAPVLVDGEVTLTESSAIGLYLADRFTEPRLAPAVASAERGPYLQWFLFAEVTVDALVVERYRAGQLSAEAQARLTRALDTLAAHLTGREFLVGATFTAADVVAASVLHLAYSLELLEAHRGLVDYVHRHTARPASRRAVALG